MRKNKNLLRYTAAFLCGLLSCLPASAATLTYPEGTTLVFNPSATLAGVNVGAIAGDPSAPVNGDIWYDSTANELTARINGANVALGSGGTGTAAGLVSIINDSGTTTNYNPASDTDAARGTALLAAVAAATTGQTVRVGAGTFALAANRLLIPDDVCLDLDPATLITGTANLSTVGPMVRPGNRSVIRGGKIEGVAASAVSQAPFGISSFVASPDTSAVDFVLDGVTLEADSDAFYILSNEACTGTIRNCTFISKYDIIYVSGYNGDPASHNVKIYNTQGIVVGPSSIASPLGRGTTIAYGATVDIHGGSLAVSDGGTTLNAGAASYEGGTLNLYGVKVTTSNGANPNYDLYTNGSGIIRVNAGAGSGTGGIFSTNSGANVTYTGNLSTGGNGTTDNAKQAVYGTGGILDATTELTVHNASTAAHAYLTDDGTIGFHAAGETNPRELVFPDDVLENEAKQLATRSWVSAQGYGSGGSLTATYIGYGGAGNSLTGEAAFSYDATTNTATIENIGATSVSAGSLAFEGATADAFETSVAVVDPTADRTFTIPNASGTAILSASNVAQAVDLGGDTSFELPNGAAPTVDAFGEIAGDNNLWATGRGAPIFYDGTASTALVNVLVSDTPTNGQVPKWNTGGTITWEDDTGGSGSGDFVGPGSSTDNAIVRFDSTTGKLGQNSTITIDDTGAVTVPEMAAPATPAAGKVSFYAKSDGLLYSKDDAGTETVVTGGGGSGGAYAPTLHTTGYAKNKILATAVPNSSSQWQTSGGMPAVSASGTASEAAISGTRPRGITYTISAATGAGGIIGNNVQFWNDWTDWTYTVIFEMGGTINVANWWIGVHPSSPDLLSSQANAISLRYSRGTGGAGDTTFKCYSNDNGGTGGEVVTDSGVTPATGTLYTVVIRKSGTSVTYYINGTLAATHTFDGSGDDMLTACRFRNNDSATTNITVYAQTVEYAIP